MPPYFTRVTANALLPQLTPLLEELQRLQRELDALAAEFAAAQQKLRSNGHAPPAGQGGLRAEVSALERQMRLLAERVAELGVLLKDPRIGLVDFPALRDGHEVYLCWRLDEPEVAWWHEIKAGYAGRQPLEE